VQNAVLKGFNKLRQFRHDSRVRTWLMSITVNEARMWLRRNCKFEHQPFDYEDGEGLQLVMEIPDPREGPFQVLERKQIRSAILKALTLLSSRDSEVFILRDLQLRSIAETARILGTSETNVKSRLRRGRLLMRQALEHLRGTRSSEQNHGSNNASRRLCNPDPVCSWPRTFANQMGVYSEVFSGDSWTRYDNTRARARCADPSFGIRTRRCESQAHVLTAGVRARNYGNLRR